MYKNKFRSWGWVKHLPQATSTWMAKKVQQRRPEKKTVFIYGNREWTEEKLMQIDALGPHSQNPGGQSSRVRPYSRLLLMNLDCSETDHYRSYTRRHYVQDATGRGFHSPTIQDTSANVEHYGREED